MAYTDEQINDFLELASEVGITKAKRELKYPNSWGTAQRWAKMRGIEIPVDEVMAKAAGTREWYKAEEVMTVAQEGFNRVWEELTTNESLTPDDQKKLAEALQKHFNVWSAAQGKAQVITENKSTDGFDARIEEMLNAEKAKNMLRKEEAPSNR
jgi:outer membrane protein assembly factor BamD (BamD/ComL family)